MYKCDFCDSNFTSNIYLTNHMKTAKYCLKIQNKEPEILFKCEKCDKILSSKKRLEYHMITHFSKECEHCKKVFNREKKYDLHFNNCIPYLLSINKTNITNNQIIVYLKPLNIQPEFIKNTIQENFTYFHFKEGQVGVADFALKHILKTPEGEQMYICSDPNRNTFQYNLDNNIKQDILK